LVTAGFLSMTLEFYCRYAKIIFSFGDGVPLITARAGLMTPGAQAVETILRLLYGPVGF